MPCVGLDGNQPIVRARRGQCGYKLYVSSALSQEIRTELMAKKRKTAWPKERFLKTGPKLRAADIHNYPGHLTDGLCEFLLWQNGGVPNLDSFVFNGPCGKNTVARVRSFYGFDKGNQEDLTDIAQTVLNHWHDLPRGSVPIGDIEIDGEDFDSCTLLTFLWGDRAEKVYFFDNPHDMGPLDPDKPSRLTQLANNLPQFIKSLQCYEDFHFREVFQLSCDRDGLRNLETALVKAGVEEFEGESVGSRSRKVDRYAEWQKQETIVYLSYGSPTIDWVPLPKKQPSDRCYFAVDVTKWNRTTILAKLKTMLRSVPEWKGVKSVGRTPTETTPYWRE